MGDGWFETVIDGPTTHQGVGCLLRGVYMAWSPDRRPCAAETNG